MHSFKITDFQQRNVIVQLENPPSAVVDGLGSCPGWLPVATETNDHALKRAKALNAPFLPNQ